MSLVVAVDIGGTTIKSALVDSSFNVIATSTAPTPKTDSTGKQTVSAISELVQTLSLHGEVSSIGVGVPGVFDVENSVSRWAGNLGWKDLPIGALLRDELDVPIAIDHDVRAATLAELRSGSAKGEKNAAFIVIGTGIAAGLIVDGSIRSAGGYAGEIGHLNVGHSYLCVCGKLGCLEAISSASAISAAYAKHSGQIDISAENVIALAAAGDPIASRIWNDALTSLTTVCEILITILAPNVIVFGGGLSQAGTALTGPISNSLSKSLTFQHKPELKIAHFGSRAGMIGCAIMAFDLIPGATP